MKPLRGSPTDGAPKAMHWEDSGIYGNPSRFFILQSVLVLHDEDRFWSSQGRKSASDPVSSWLPGPP